MQTKKSCETGQRYSRSPTTIFPKCNWGMFPPWFWEFREVFRKGLSVSPLEE
jgi:hypothetical protein